jgi:hypothetical protein
MGHPNVGSIDFFAAAPLPHLKAQPEDFTLLKQLKRLHLGGSDGSISDQEDSDGESSKDIKINRDSEVKKAEETTDRSIRFPGHLSVSL